MRYEDAVASLYQVPLDQFVAERKRLADALKAAGDKAGAAALAKRARPPISAWVVDQLWWQARPAFEALFATAQALRDGKLDAMAPHREAIARLRSQAAKILISAAHGATEATLRKVTQTLAALAATGSWDPDPPGALSLDRDPPGFEAAGIAALEATPAPAPRPPPSSAAPRPRAPRPPPSATASRPRCGPRAAISRSASARSPSSSAISPRPASESRRRQRWPPGSRSCSRSATTEQLAAQVTRMSTTTSTTTTTTTAPRIPAANSNSRWRPRIGRCFLAGSCVGFIVSHAAGMPCKRRTWRAGPSPTCERAALRRSP